MKQKSAVFTSNAFVLFSIVVVMGSYSVHAFPRGDPNLPICCEGQTCAYAEVDRKTDVVLSYLDSFKCQCGPDKWCVRTDIYVGNTRQYKCGDWVKHDK